MPHDGFVFLSHYVCVSSIVLLHRCSVIDSRTPGSGQLCSRAVFSTKPTWSGCCQMNALHPCIPWSGILIASCNFFFLFFFVFVTRRSEAIFQSFLNRCPRFPGSGRPLRRFIPPFGQDTMASVCYVNSPPGWKPLSWQPPLLPQPGSRKWNARGPALN